MKKRLILLFLLLPVICPAQSSSSVFVHFATDKWDLTAATRARLDSLTDSLDLSARIELHGHCDARGGDAYNERLALKRVNAVQDYLLNNGWEKQDITIAQGHGEKLPLNNNGTEKEMGLNRRVEIKIITGKTNNNQSLTERLADSTATAGTHIVLKNINFIGGMHQFLPESSPMLQELLNAMNTYPKLVIRIEGHICCEQHPGEGLDLETNIYNLSAARAKAIMEYLIANGIAAERVSFKGFGHSSPIYPYPEKTEEERIQNRRVEIKIISR